MDGRCLTERVRQGVGRSESDNRNGPAAAADRQDNGCPGAPTMHPQDTPSSDGTAPATPRRDAPARQGAALGGHAQNGRAQESGLLGGAVQVRLPDGKPDAATTRTDLAAQQPIIRALDFSLYYGAKVGVAHITMDIYPQSVTAIIGPSGCGKSTFLRSINRMNDLIPGVHTQGRLLVGGVNVYDKRVNLANLRQQVGMVFQKPNPFPKSVYDNVAFGRRLQGAARADLDETVETCLRAAALWDEVKDSLRKSALALSGGQQQRLCIARALATRPKVLLMDEPCSALDPIATARIEELIAVLKRDYTIIIVTHNMQQAARVSDRTAFFCLGELVEYDRTPVIFTKPGRRQTEDYVTGRFG